MISGCIWLFFWAGCPRNLLICQPFRAQCSTNSFIIPKSRFLLNNLISLLLISPHNLTAPPTNSATSMNSFIKSGNPALSWKIYPLPNTFHKNKTLSPIGTNKTHSKELNPNYSTLSMSPIKLTLNRFSTAKRAFTHCSTWWNSTTIETDLHSLVYQTATCFPTYKKLWFKLNLKGLTGNNHSHNFSTHTNRK